MLTFGSQASGKKVRSSAPASPCSPLRQTPVVSPIHHRMPAIVTEDDHKKLSFSKGSSSSNQALSY